VEGDQDLAVAFKEFRRRPDSRADVARNLVRSEPRLRAALRAVAPDELQKRGQQDRFVEHTDVTELDAQ